MISGYSNDSLGYMPDAHDVERKTYAAYQSPKFTGQFPFTAESGGVLVQAMLDAPMFAARWRWAAGCSSVPWAPSLARSPDSSAATLAAS